MKKVIAILFLLGLACLHLQVDGGRLGLEQIRSENIDNQLQSNAPVASTDINSNDEHGKSSSYGNIPVRVSAPVVEEDNDNSSSSRWDSDDETNSSYGNYGNPSGSSTETHHVYSSDCNPKKGC
ncbi:uncharacterized protein LOC110621798 [Manihot esculenta]|uniref:Uncharacterized protein n=2 Tax=Manihot esculenta TaxID=3983 RepID=A0ACB7HAU7_MANES|nr:uncharacterized protein LOC110621798 [Manihot esculenta]XP_021621795.1 uncharacterized protein LOC110621798 [Manihot esculenta]KAG8649615.1 hypothetical protein MANES_08G110600v8 [Manihot esculenta]OAY43953.1 hypothetical protein MANES_08G110600v8 [Manihot esculenta]